MRPEAFPSDTTVTNRLLQMPAGVGSAARQKRPMTPRPASCSSAGAVARIRPHLGRFLASKWGLRALALALELELEA